MDVALLLMPLPLPLLLPPLVAVPVGALPPTTAPAGRGTQLVAAAPLPPLVLPGFGLPALTELPALTNGLTLLPPLALA